MKFLITGGAGFIGSNAVEYFLAKGHEITVLDNLLSGKYDNIKSFVENQGVRFINGDIRDEDCVKKILADGKIDVCVNYAALVSVAESTENPALTEDINVRGMINLLKNAGARGLKVFVHASSAAVYGDNPELPKLETMIPEPKSPYAVSKIAGEYYNRYFSEIMGFRAVNCRFFNVFGPKQNPDSQYAAAIPIFLKRAISNKDITIYGDGDQTRDFIYVKDLISAIDFLIERSLKWDNFNPVFNLGYGNFISINELVKKIISITGSKSKIIYENPRPGDIKYSYASNGKIKSLGWGDRITGFEKGLAEAIDWYKNHIE